MLIFRALKHRDYRLYFSGQLVSWIGTWMQSLALAWMVHRLTGQPKWLGIVAFANQIPMFFLSPLGGVLADRLKPRTIAIVTQSLLLLQALAMTALAIHGHPPVSVVLVLSVFMGTVNAFDLASRNVLVALCVPHDDLPNAIALNSSLFHGSRILGPTLAGITLATIGESWCFFINAMSYLAALAALFMMRAGSTPPEKSESTLRSHLAEGINYAARHPELRIAFLFVGFIVLLGMPYAALMPIFADTILNAGPKGMGWLMGAGGVGATIGALLLAKQKDGSKLPLILPWAALSLGIAITFFANAKSLPLAMIFLGLTSLSVVTTNTGTNTLVNLIVPQRLRGRVLSLYASIFMGAMPLGALAAGYAAQVIGAPRTLTLGAIGCLLAAMAFARFYPTQRAGEQI